MQDQVFEYLSSFSRPQDEKEEAEVGTDQAELNSESKDQKRSVVRSFPLFVRPYYAHEKVESQVATLDEEDEADAREIGTKCQALGYKVKIRLLDQSRELPDEKDLQEEKATSDACFTRAAHPTIEEWLFQPLAHRVGSYYRSQQEGDADYKVNDFLMLCRRQVKNFADFLFCREVLQSENEEAEPLKDKLHGVQEPTQHFLVPAELLALSF